MCDPVKPRLKQLASAAFEFPIIDIHAHNLLLGDHRSALPFEGLTSEASGEALNDAVHTAAFYRAIVQLARLFNCEPTFEAVKRARDALKYDTLCVLCFKSTGIVSLLLDDGLDKIEEMCHDFRWHDCLTSESSKRIVRIEVLAQELLKQQHAQDKIDLIAFSEKFESLLIESCMDPQIAGFKSVACYRTGLNIAKHEETEVAAQYLCAISDLKATGDLRLAHKAFNDYIVRLVLKIAGHFRKPVQFHTGLGDNDIRLVSASPASMQPVIIEFPHTDFVLLHSGYPFTQEAGYLASVYKNVYLDFGEVFPIVSAEGQRTILRQVLEITPSSKILWSTDGHWWPETYYLAVLQVREALFEVLSDSVCRGEMSELHAVDIIERALFHNANALYGLKLTTPETNGSIPPQQTGSALISATSSTLTLDGLAARGIRFVRINFVDYCSVVRNRIVPIKRLQRMIAKNVRPGVGFPKAALAVVRLQIPATVSASGEYLLVPDLTALRVCPFADGHAFVMGTFEEKDPVIRADGSKSLDVDVDPRTVLKRAMRSAEEQDGLNFLIGFELEFVLLVPEGKFPTPVNEHDYAVSGALPTGSAATKTLDDIVDALEACGIELEQYHSEAAEGQPVMMKFEVVTGPLPPLQAVDALILTREIIVNMAAKNGLWATFSPRPFEHTCGSAMHTHISLTSSSTRASTPAQNERISELEASFLQSLLDHLPALCAFTLSSPASYDRVKDGIWSGGTWVTWGYDNREVPIRLCGTAMQGWHLEVKALDATANPYLALAALLHAGTLGVRKKLPLRMRDCPVLAAHLSEAEREALGIITRMPLNLEQAINNLQKDEEITSLFGDNLIATYIGAIEIRRNIVSQRSAEQQREWMAKFY